MNRQAVTLAGRASGSEHIMYGGTAAEDLVDFMSPLRGVILDIGCGTGGWAGALRAYGAETLVGIEADPHAAAVASDLYDDVWIGRVEESPLERWASCDLIICADSLEHLLDPWLLLSRLRKIAGPTTRLAVSVPNLAYWGTIIRLASRGEFEYSADGGYFDIGHLRWFTRKSLSSALANTGWLITAEGGRTGERLKKLSANSFLSRYVPDAIYQQIFVMASPTDDAPGLA